MTQDDECECNALRAQLAIAEETITTLRLALQDQRAAQKPPQEAL